MYFRKLVINFSGTKIMSPGCISGSSFTFLPFSMAFRLILFTSTNPGEIRR